MIILLCWYGSKARGGVLSPKSYVDVPAGPQKSDYLYTNFLPNFPPISIPFSNEKHQILIELGAFYNNLPKIHPIYVIWAPSSLMKPPPPIAIPIFAKKCPKSQAHIRIPCQCENPPPPGVQGSLCHIAAGSHPIQEAWWSQDSLYRGQNQKFLQCCQ